jgi:hypothetical protein
VASYSGDSGGSGSGFATGLTSSFRKIVRRCQPHQSPHNCPDSLDAGAFFVTNPAPASGFAHQFYGLSPFSVQVAGE